MTTPPDTSVVKITDADRDLFNQVADFLADLHESWACGDIEDIPGLDPEVANRAAMTLRGIVAQFGGTVTFDGESGEWRPAERLGPDGVD